MKHFFEDLNDTCAKDFIKVFLGKEIGRGVSRVVYEHALDKSLVIKIEEGGDWFQNVTEYRVWNELQYYKKMAKWFAPIIAISPNGVVLIQKRVEPTSLKDYPKQIPSFFTDIKQENYGLLNGQLVCFDYGTSLFTKGFSTKLKNANWPVEKAKKL